MTSEHRHADIIRAGLAWLYDTEQPDGALLQHHGAHITTAHDSRVYQFAPDGDRGTPVVAVEVARPRYDDIAGEWVCLTPLRLGELAELAAFIAAEGVPVRGTWNGEPGQHIGSVGLGRRAGLSLRDAVSLYRHGCPEHDSVFCPDDGCRWYANGKAHVVWPTHPGASRG